MAARQQNLVMEDVRLLFRNFSGKEGTYNREGDRNFCVLVDPQQAETLRSHGWNIKYLKPREEGELPQPYIHVAVNFKSKRRPPRIVMISSRGRTTLTEDDVNILDWVELKSVDLILNPYEWLVNGKQGVKAYLQAIYVTIYEDALELKYSEGAPDSALSCVNGVCPPGYEAPED